mgnify:CR=1 FL=1
MLVGSAPIVLGGAVLLARLVPSGLVAEQLGQLREGGRERLDV